MEAKFLFTFALLIAATSAIPRQFSFNADLDQHWETFKTTYGKVYENEFELVRRMIWEKNVKMIQKHNLEYDMGGHTYTLGMNEFGDKTHAEFKAQYLGLKTTKLNHTGDLVFMSPLNVHDLPDAVDWRTKGYVTPVKNQGSCGSCWAFSTTGSVEGQHARQTGTLVSLSEQQLVDCSKAFGNQGCDGGLMDNAFKYIIANKGIDTEVSYSYKGVDGACKFNPKTVGATISGFADVPEGDESKLQQAVATVGPISVAIDASQDSFQFYKSGVYNEPACSSTELDHGVLAAGYGTDSGSKYWLVKNSWGTTWGIQGYIMMSRDAKNQCGIATSASYPLV